MPLEKFYALCLIFSVCIYTFFFQLAKCTRQQSFQFQKDFFFKKKNYLLELVVLTVQLIGINLLLNLESKLALQPATFFVSNFEIMEEISVAVVNVKFTLLNYVHS
jgi:hypothetical protein